MDHGWNLHIGLAGGWVDGGMDGSKDSDAHGGKRETAATKRTPDVLPLAHARL